MGADMSSPIDEQKQEQIQKIVSDFVATFGQIFPGSYKAALIESIKEGAQLEETDEYQLPVAPTPDTDLKSGTITKKCVFMGAWKPNYFIATNKSENFRIDYYDSEGGTRKGSINCCGYKPEADGSNELAPHGIKVVPSSDSRRTFYLRFESAEEREEWLEVIKNACAKAEPAKDEDELIRKAFAYAYHDIRVHYGFYGGYRLRYSEAEELSDLLSDILYRDVAQGIIDGIAPGILHGMAVKTVRKFIDSTAMTSVTAAWNAGREGCKNAKATIEEAAKNLLEPLFEQEAVIKEQITEKMSDKINPFLESMGEKVFKPLLGLIVKSISKAYIGSMSELAVFLMNEIKEENLKGEKVAASIKRIHRSVDMWHHGLLTETNKILYDMYDKDLKIADHVFSAAGGGYCAHDIYTEFLDGIRDLAHRAVHAFEKALADVENKEDTVVKLREVHGRYVHDCTVSLKGVLNNVLSGIARPSFESTVLSGVASAVEPIQEFVDAIPIPGLPDLFCLPNFTEDVLQGVLDSAIGAAVDAAFVNVEASFNKEGSKISAEIIVT